MWYVLVLVILSGPMAGDKYTYQPGDEPVPHRFESLEECKKVAQEVVLPAAQEALPEGTRFGVACLKDDPAKNFST